MRPHAEDLVCTTVSDEMDAVNVKLRTGINDITVADLSGWSIDKAVYPVTEKFAPVLLRIIRSAATTHRATEKNVLKDRDAGCNVIITQLGNFRSQRSLSFAAYVGLFCWATGSGVQTIDTLNRLGLSIAYDSIQKLLSQLANQMITRNRQVARGPHAMCYDNINISTSTFTEQRTSGPAKVTSGTFSMLYAIENVPPSVFSLAPILARAEKATDLTYADIRPTAAQATSFLSQFEKIVAHVLTKYSEEFIAFANDPLLQHTPRTPQPDDHMDKEFPMKVTTTDEASVPGNIKHWDDTYITQLEYVPVELVDTAIPTIGIGLFHLIMNLIWRFLALHRGSLKQIGSLTHLFSVINKARLGGEKPDYHSLLAALTQIFDGLILNAWRAETGGLGKYAKTSPTAEDILAMAR
ncbi:hypothetical protein PLICRDRAFT_71144, partial [Plicaturopsis crispa FD-325 SS-3]